MTKIAVKKLVSSWLHTVIGIAQTSDLQRSANNHLKNKKAEDLLIFPAPHSLDRPKIEQNVWFPTLNL